MPLLETNATRWQEALAQGRQGTVAERARGFGANVFVFALYLGDRRAADRLIAGMKESGFSDGDVRGPL